MFVIDQESFVISCAMPMPETQTPVLPEQSEDIGTGSGGSIVIVFNNEKNTYEEVTMILQKATGCSLDEAQMETWEIDHLGKSVVHHSSQEECERVASIIRTIGIQVEVRPD